MPLPFSPSSRAPRVSWGLAALACLLAPALAAQPAAPEAPIDLVLRGVPADAALAAVAEATGRDVVYSSELVGEAPVWCGGTGWRADDLLRCITDAVGLDYARRSSGTYVVTERVVEPAAAGAVAGLVVDGVTGEPLPLAHIRLAGATTVTDADGRFSVSGVAPGPHVLLASYVGYREQAVRLAVAPGGRAEKTVGLRPVVATVGAVVVDGFEARLASERLGADVGFEVLPDRIAGRAGALAEGTALSAGAPAVTSSADGPALQPLLGVSGRTFRDGLSLQGGEPGEHALTLDGARIYEPLAIGPALGAMSPLAVGRVTVRKAGFGAASGSHLAGLVEAEHALARPAAGWAVAAEGDVYAASARVQHAARLGTWRGAPVEATTLVAARRSLWDALRPGALDASLREWNAVDPVLASVLAEDAPGARGAPRTHYDAHRHGSELAFSDLHAATRVRFGALRSLRASVYHGDADVSTELFAVGAPQAGDIGPDPAASFLARDATRWTNTAATLRGDALVSSRWRLGGGARLSRHRLSQRYDALDGLAAGLDGTETADVSEARLVAGLDALALPDNGNALTELTAEADAAVALGLGQELRLAVEATAVSSRFHLLSAGYGETAFRDLDADHGQLRLATAVSGRHRLGERWTLEPGLRLTTLAASGDVFAEPRLAVRYDAVPGDRLEGVAARLAAGVYRQFASRVELATFGPSALVPDVAVWLPTDGTVAPLSALHLAGEVLWQPSSAWSARVEGYAKALPRVYALDYAALLSAGAPLADQADFLLPEEGRAVGVGLRLERQAPRWAASAGVAWARTERRSDARFGGRWVAAPWEAPRRATLGLDVLALGSRDILAARPTGAGLLVRARALGVWGRSWALRRAYYDVLPAAGTDTLDGFALDAPEADRLAPLLTLDLGVAWTQTLGGARTELALDVANVLDRRNVLDWSLRPDADGALGAVTRTLPGIQPSLRLRVGL